MDDTTRIVGFHGTTPARASIIRCGLDFRPSQRDTEFLGKGVYFYLEFMDAERWALRYEKKIGIVIEVEITAEQRAVLDADRPEFRERVDRAYREVSRLLREENRTLEPWRKSHDVFQLIWSMDPALKVIMASAEPPFKERDIPVKHVRKEICVRNRRCITIVSKKEVFAS